MWAAPSWRRARSPASPGSRPLKPTLSAASWKTVRPRLLASKDWRSCACSTPSTSPLTPATRFASTAFEQHRAEGELRMPMPKADEVTRDYFHSLLPEDPRLTVRPMFGNLAGFVNGNMFTGVFG